VAKPIPGRPPKISAEEMRWIALAVKDNTPQQFEFGLWTLSLMRELINRRFGKSLSLESVRRIMKLLGFPRKNRCTRRGSRIPSWSANQSTCCTDWLSA
jgi:transposase